VPLAALELAALEAPREPAGDARSSSCPRSSSCCRRRPSGRPAASSSCPPASSSGAARPSSRCRRRPSGRPAASSSCRWWRSPVSSSCPPLSRPAASSSSCKGPPTWWRPPSSRAPPTRPAAGRSTPRPAPGPPPLKRCSGARWLRLAGLGAPSSSCPRPAGRWSTSADSPGPRAAGASAALPDSVVDGADARRRLPAPGLRLGAGDVARDVVGAGGAGLALAASGWRLAPGRAPGVGVAHAGGGAPAGGAGCGERRPGRAGGRERRPGARGASVDGGAVGGGEPSGGEPAAGSDRENGAQGALAIVLRAAAGARHWGACGGQRAVGGRSRVAGIDQRPVDLSMAMACGRVVPSG
jgi:hypothetical protein